MTLKVVTTASDTVNPGWKEIEASLKRFGWDYEVIVHPFCFGKQLPIIADWCRKNRQKGLYILYTDAWDTLALSTPEEVFQKMPDCKMLISCEKACYPLPEMASQYPETPFEWKYVNGGGWLVEADFFIEMADKHRLDKDSHDQIWLHELYLSEREQGGIYLDTACKIFQSIAFEGPEDFSYRDYSIYQRIYNRKTETMPVFIHGNGHTDMTNIYNLLK